MQFVGEQDFLLLQPDICSDVVFPEMKRNRLIILKLHHWDADQLVLGIFLHEFGFQVLYRFDQLVSTWEKL